VFGWLEASAMVRDLGVTDVNINGSGDQIGGLAGGNSGTVSQCYSSGMVAGNFCVGGLVGWNWPLTVSQCHSTAAVSGNWAVGGLVGHADGGSIAMSYSTGLVAGDSYIGGS
jgi:hypothetical protein